MNYSNMIKTEDTDLMFDRWKNYRENLTEYIRKSIRANYEATRWVAIWGAGGCNDIDILELSKEYNLLLIDRDLDKLVSVRERLGISQDCCKVADVDFWHIIDEEYEVFDALLMDGAGLEEFEVFFNDLMEGMAPAVNLEDYSVDCSVVVGLASQLNARFAALLHLHNIYISQDCNEGVLRILDRMNKLASERLFISVRQLTKSLIIAGYETDSCHSEDEAYEKGYRLKEGLEEGVAGGYFLSGEETALIKVAGNEHWHRLLYKAVLMDKLEDVGECQVINWPFAEGKNYPMLMVSLLVT